MEILEEISKNLKSHFINSYYFVDNKIVVYQSCSIISTNPLLFEILKYCRFDANLLILNLKYLPKSIYPDVKGTLDFTDLESKVLKKLILYPGASRQLAYNIINNNI